MMLYTNEIRQVRDCFFIKILEYNLIEGIDKVYIRRKQTYSYAYTYCSK